MNPAELSQKKRLFAAAMLAGDFSTAEQLAVEIEPYSHPIEDDHAPEPIPCWGCDS